MLEAGVVLVEGSSNEKDQAAISYVLIEKNDNCKR